MNPEYDPDYTRTRSLPYHCGRDGFEYQIHGYNVKHESGNYYSLVVQMTHEDMDSFNGYFDLLDIHDSTIGRLNDTFGLFENGHYIHTMIDMHRDVLKDHMSEIWQWLCQNNLTSRWFLKVDSELELIWCFEDPEIATLFKLTWA